MRIFVLAFLTLAMTSGLASAEDLRANPTDTQSEKWQANQIDIEYVEPASPEMRTVYDLVKKAEILEKIRSMLVYLRLPHRLLLKMQSCKGEADAWYGKRGVTVCYEFVDHVWKKVPERTTPGGITPMDAFIGPTIDAFLHEAGHAVFDLWKVPVLGREEDAADYFSAYLMLQFDKQQARRLIMGTAYQYLDHVRSRKEVTIPLAKLADPHGMPAQRLFNVLCIAYGSNEQEFSDFVTKGYLPKERAEDCKEEYQQEAYAFEKLLSPYIEPGLVQHLTAHKLPPADRHPPRRDAR